MIIVVSFEELLDSGHWEDFCEDKGYNVYMVNEGCPETETVNISKEEAIKYGLIKE